MGFTLCNNICMLMLARRINISFSSSHSFLFLPNRLNSNSPLVCESYNWLLPCSVILVLAFIILMTSNIMGIHSLATLLVLTLATLLVLTLATLLVLTLATLLVLTLATLLVLTLATLLVLTLATVLAHLVLSLSLP